MKPSLFGSLTIAGLMLSSPLARATEFPAQKPGLWETRMEHAARKGPAHAGVSQHCLDAAALEHGKQVAADFAKKSCTRNETTRAGSRWTTTMVCKVGASTMTTLSVTDAPTDSAYHTEMTMTYDPPMAGESRSTTTMDGKWLGACKAQ
jgi:hypothetical protein